ncbi:MAG: hypothetical protein IPM95_16155 [Sphingobacteriales bacterium]|nr:hypothetical protein [Sphingobacteriales bacterium]
MEHLLQLFIYLPLLAFLLSLFINKNSERPIATIAIASISVHLMILIVITALWIWNSFTTIDIKHLVLYKSKHFEFFINFYYDVTTAAYAMVGSVVSLSVTVFSKYYMHRDEGYKRFFNTLLFFYLGYNFVIFSGNFETLFIGWEILGITSFLLIAFYRDRYLPVKNGLKVISLYRLGDVCLIVAMWMAHHIFHKNITFHELHTAGFLDEVLLQHPVYIQTMCLLIVVAVSIKSAQLPFSSWLARAMEGPTVSSAIFYGSLSVHLGVFLLIRTYPLWEDNFGIKLLLVAIGLFTSIIASGISSVQSSVKTQIAYSSITQIGIMFIEVALGLHILALLHFAGNAFLRTYQLLVSPSVLSYLIHDMVFSYSPAQSASEHTFMAKIKNTVFLLNVREWNVDQYLYRILWQPFKWIGNTFKFLDKTSSLVAVGVFYFIGLFGLLFEGYLPAVVVLYLDVSYAVLAFIFIVKAFTERDDAIRAWLYIIASQLLIALAISMNEHINFMHIALYLSGILLAAISGLICLLKIKAIDNDISLNYFHGYAHERKGVAALFLLSCLALLGFPFTPTFIGIDLLFTYIHTHETLLIISIALGFILIEVAVLRIYARIFLGQHKKAYHPIAYRSS